MKKIKLSMNMLFIGCSIIVLGFILILNFFLNQKSDVQLLTGKHYVEMTVQDYGTIQLELDADIAPITVTNFIQLVKDQFYDGLTFHRIVSGFVIQG